MLNTAPGNPKTPSLKFAACVQVGQGDPRQLRVDFDDECLEFALKDPPRPNIPQGRYSLIHKGEQPPENAHLYRLRHPLGEFVLEARRKFAYSTPFRPLIPRQAGHPDLGRWPPLRGITHPVRCLSFCPGEVQMPAESLSMRKIKEVLRLIYDQRLSARQVALAAGLARATVAAYRQRFEQSGLHWPEADAIDDATLEQRLFPAPPACTAEERAEPHCALQ